VRKELTIVFVSRISEIIDSALEVLVANPPPPIAYDQQRDRSTHQTEPESVAVRQP
jgi:hypothetical protein